MIPVRVAQEKNTRNAADSIKRRRCGPHRMVTLIDQILRHIDMDAKRYISKRTTHP